MSGYRLLFYIDHLKRGSGLENSAVNLCLALKRKGHEVHVCCNNADEFSDLTIHNNIKLLPALIESLKPDLTIDWGFFQEADLHRMGQGTHKGYMALYLDAFKGVKRQIKELEYKRPKHQRKIAQQEKLLQNPNAFFMGNSQQTSDMAIAGGAVPDHVRTYHQTVDLNHFSRARIDSMRTDFRSEFNIADDDVLFLFVAHNLKLKNIKLLKHLFDDLPEHAKLMIIGKRKPAKMNSNMIYAGIQKDMSRVYAGGDAILHPTYFDSCTNVVLEAMSCELPMIVSDTAGINEIIRDQKDGYVISVRDAGHEEAWKHHITELLDKDLRFKLGQSARETAETRNFSSFVDWFENYLHDIHNYKQNH